MSTAHRVVDANVQIALQRIRFAALLMDLELCIEWRPARSVVVIVGVAT